MNGCETRFADICICKNRPLLPSACLVVIRFDSDIYRCVVHEKPRCRRRIRIAGVVGRMKDCRRVVIRHNRHPNVFQLDFPSFRYAPVPRATQSISTSAPPPGPHRPDLQTFIQIRTSRPRERQGSRRQVTQTRQRRRYLSPDRRCRCSR